MSSREFEGWIDYFNRHPFDDLHRYHRPALIAGDLLREGVNVKVLMNWLTNGEAIVEDADANTLRVLGVSRPKGK